SRGILGLLKTRDARVKLIVKPVKRERAETKTSPASAPRMKPVPAPAPPRQQEVSPVEQPEPAAEEYVARARSFIEGVLERLGIDAEIAVEQVEGVTTLSLTGDEIGLLIGRRGETLNALQYLSNLVAAKAGRSSARLVLDAAGYRARRLETLQRLGKRLARKVKQYGKQVVLEPMAPHERRAIHLALKNDPDVYTYSEGEEPYRRVVIALRKKENGERAKENRRRDT
ncbi:MAG: RNA-binding cell elongation regulator Jag/EloR, partial [Bacillota bacterium]|nr:RNA-binding cell elongation regulator Jag/EloR [Bacillota bacterium]